MGKLRRFRVWAVIAVAVLCLCAVAYATLPAAIYGPLKVGDAWTYKFTFPGQSFTESITITGSFLKSGLTWYAAKTTGLPGGPTIVNYHQATTGLWCYTPMATTPSPYCAIKAPLTLGSTWTMTTAPSYIKHTITSLSATTTVPAGTFTHCLLITQTYPNNPGFRVKFWYAPNVGTVRDEIWSGTVKTETAVLTKYTLK